ncbi:MAG: hypothetical protein Kow00121_59280 [Elainellaceae cyanobacterium]
MFQLAHISLYWLIRTVQPLFVPICFVCAWAIILLLVWNIWAAIRDGVNNARRMHQIPCADCRFFTGNYHLKCPVHPKQALSDEAINCQDYEPANYLATLNQD